jgi:5'(3')-deoxyribonucleotidase
LNHKLLKTKLNPNLVNIAIDCDDVLADYVTALAQEYNQRHGTNYTPGKITPVAGMWKEWHGEEMVGRLWDITRDREFNESLVPISGSQEGIAQLIAQGAEMYIVTSRVSESDQTLQWLQKHYGNVFQDIFYASSARRNGRLPKGEICQQHDLGIAVDDHPSNAFNLRDNGIRTLLFDHEWNWGVSECNLLQRVRSWEEIVAVIKSV